MTDEVWDILNKLTYEQLLLVEEFLDKLDNEKEQENE